MKVTANYHGHTYRCGHAYGQDEEYVQAALEMGFEVMGFADHVILPGFSQYPMRADYDKLPEEIRRQNRDLQRLRSGVARRFL